MEELIALQEKISFQLNKKKIGSVFKVMVDEEDDRYYIGRTEFDSPEVDDSVLISKKEKLQIGEFYSVLIEKADHFDLYGKKI